MTPEKPANDRQYSTVFAGIGRVFVDCYGGQPIEIVVNGKTIRFSFSDIFGPLPKNKSGGELALPPNHPFWRAVSWWRLQGAAVEDGVAVWRTPRKPVYERRGRELVVVDAGEEGWDW